MNAVFCFLCFGGSVLTEKLLKKTRLALSTCITQICKSSELHTDGKTRYELFSQRAWEHIDPTDDVWFTISISENWPQPAELDSL